MTTEIKCLFSVIGKVDCSDATGFCLSGSHTPKYYGDWEKEIATPALQKLGYKVIRIFTGDGDSFGPLTRVFVVDKDGIRSELMYG